MDGRWPAWAAIGSMAACLVGCAGWEAEDPDLSAVAPLASSFAPPDLATIPATPEGDLVRLGFRLVTDTKREAGSYVGNNLTCSNCHLDAGRRLGAAPFVGVTHFYPEYRARNARVNTLEDRLNDCFERSLNGRPLPRGSREQRALVAYLTWLSRGVTKEAARSWRGLRRIAAPRRPDPARGRALFADRCAGCHGGDGGGTVMGPPVWGAGSYNIGAGLARVGLAAAFIKANMPLGQGGTLTDEDAYNLAAFINSQPRPDFARKAADWPKGGKPADVPY